MTVDFVARVAEHDDAHSRPIAFSSTRAMEIVAWSVILPAGRSLVNGKSTRKTVVTINCLSCRRRSRPAANGGEVDQRASLFV
jgi:hypothetical protein